MQIDFSNPGDIFHFDKNYGYEEETAAAAATAESIDYGSAVASDYDVHQGRHSPNSKI
jgi:hypothetical protein